MIAQRERAMPRCAPAREEQDGDDNRCDEDASHAVSRCTIRARGCVLDAREFASRADTARVSRARAQSTRVGARGSRATHRVQLARRLAP